MDDPLLVFCSNAREENRYQGGAGSLSGESEQTMAPFKRKKGKDCDRINGTDGFTLIEVLMAMVIFAIGILGVAKMQISAIGGNANALAMTEKVSLASSHIERLMGLPYTHGDLALTEGTPRTFTSWVSGYAVTCTVEDQDDDSTIPADTKRVVITVSPVAGSGGGQPVSIEQLIADIE